MWRKVGALACVSLYAFVANFASSSLSSVIPALAAPGMFGPPQEGPYAIDKLTYFVSTNVLLCGAASIWWVPLAQTFGRRSIILVGILVMTLSSMWAGLALHNYNSFLAARIVMGIGEAPADTVCPDIVGSCFFVHQRGRAMVSGSNSS